jgi:hypothetical protein
MASSEVRLASGVAVRLSEAAVSRRWSEQLTAVMLTRSMCFYLQVVDTILIDVTFM